MSDEPLRLFVPPGSCAGDELQLIGAEAARVFGRGARAGSALLVLDDSGWALDVALDVVEPERCHGWVRARSLASERRTKVSLYQGLLHPSDFRRLLARATAEGVVAFIPLITDGSVVPALGASGEPEGEMEWPRLVRDAAEASGRGRRPGIGQTMLFDHALDEASRHGTVLLCDPTGELGDQLGDRPFAIDVFCPPPGGFSGVELARARARSVPIVAAPGVSDDPIQPALRLLGAIYAHLEAN